jgi:putative ABC transport system substrate-binding protein
MEASRGAQFESGFEAFRKMHADAVVVGTDAFFNDRVDKLAASVLRNLPTIYEYHQFVASSGLASYGRSVAEAHGNAGLSFGRTLNGEKPADLPVVQSTKIELTVNRRTAKALGLAVPASLLARADEVIE